MNRTLIIAAALASFFVTSAIAAETSSSSKAPSVRLAKGPAKKGQPKESPKAGPKAAPENARSDPRATESAPPPAPASASSAPAAPGGEARRGMSRIEFDDRLVQGQTNKANAIYLFERRESALRSLLKKRTDFHEEIDETLE